MMAKTMSVMTGTSPEHGGESFQSLGAGGFLRVLIEAKPLLRIHLEQRDGSGNVLVVNLLGYLLFVVGGEARQ